MEMKSMKGIHVHQIVGGHGHCIMIARNDSDEDNDKIKSLPLFKPMGACA